MSIVDDVPTEPFSGVMLHTIQQWQTKKGGKPLTASIEKHSSNQVQTGSWFQGSMVVLDRHYHWILLGYPWEQKAAARILQYCIYAQQWELTITIMNKWKKHNFKRSRSNTYLPSTWGKNRSHRNKDKCPNAKETRFGRRSIYLRQSLRCHRN